MAAAAAHNGGVPPPPNAEADQLPGVSSTKHGRAGTQKVAEAAQATANSATPDKKKSSSSSSTLTNILGHYASTATPSTARINPQAQPNTSPIALTVGNLWRYIPLVASTTMSIGSAIASHAIYGPPKKSWGVEMSVFTRIMRDCGQHSEFATIGGLQQFFDLGSLLPVPKDGLITPVTFRVKKRNLRGFLNDSDAEEDGKRELTAEWVVTKSTWKRLQTEWRKAGPPSSATAGTSSATNGNDATAATSSTTATNASETKTSSPGQRSQSAPSPPGADVLTSLSAASANPSATSLATNGNAVSSPTEKLSSIDSSGLQRRPTSKEPNVSSNATGPTRSGSIRNPSSSGSGKPKRERIIYYIHGGAYFVMSAATHRPLTISLSKYAECRVFAINYRLAPGTKFPGALHDCVSGWFRLVEDLGIPPQNIVLGADSAGGGLALALLCYLRDEKYELPAGAMLFSPWVDLTLSCDSWDTNSKYDYLSMPPSGNHMNPVHAYLGDNIETYLTHPYASPLFADLHGLPPLLIQCGDAEVLRDEGTLLAHKASLAGVSVRHELYEDCVHVFQAFLFLDASRKALQSARHFMRTALDSPAAKRGASRRHRLPHGSSRRVSKGTSGEIAAGTASAGTKTDGKADTGASATGTETGADVSVEKQAASVADAAKKRLQQQLDIAEGGGVSSGAEDTGNETEEGEDAKLPGRAGAPSARATALAGKGEEMDASTRDRMDAEMRAGMGNVRGQRVEPTTGERRHHHHHSSRSSRRHQQQTTQKVGDAVVGETKPGDEAAPAPPSGSTSSSATDATAADAKADGGMPSSAASDETSSSSDEDDDDGADEDEEFAYARTKKGSLMGSAAGSLTSSAAAAFKAMQHRSSSSSATSSTITTPGAGVGDGVPAPMSADAPGAAGGDVSQTSASRQNTDQELLASFHPPTSVLTPRIRQSSLGGLRAAQEAVGPLSASTSGRKSLQRPTSANDATYTGTPADDLATNGDAVPTANGGSASLDSSPVQQTPAKSRPGIARHQSSSSHLSVNALSSLMESYKANPGALRTNVYTPSGGPGSGGAPST
ncbi:hypothetical protein OC846_005504 [Tilletia horrida]|uniref:Alpha/beta hydrolase fold-3 domain-containing protein n=1 Tax=Tilletia horrida TaxID=155126 RepID=A0AAN6JPG5_9BASI|nr:hypothetical protein OC846_005504 [Tilletia horrida]KAK0551550.1 hypothetical protein OC845_002130 [Tilletia horrida]KAK0569516.1 hypothetical protein OC861_000889 [Tilletia horrida]